MINGDSARDVASLPAGNRVPSAGATYPQTVKFWTHLERCGYERVVEARVTFRAPDHIESMAWCWPSSLVEHPFRDALEEDRVLGECFR